MTTHRNVWDDLHDLIKRRDEHPEAARETEKAIDDFVDRILATARRLDMIYEVKEKLQRLLPDRYPPTPPKSGPAAPRPT